MSKKEVSPVDNKNEEKLSSSMKSIYVPKYISQNLTKEEKILVAEQTSGWLYKPLSYTLFFLTGILILFFICILLGATDEDNPAIIFVSICITGGYALWHLLSNQAIEMAVTNKRVILKTGIFIHKTDELRLEKVESVNIRKDFFGLIFGYGKIIFTGTGNRIIIFDGIANPQKTKNNIDEVFETYAN